MSLRSNVTCGQMSHGQMSLAVKCPAVKCHCGQMSQNLEVVKSPWSNVPWSNETVVIGDPIRFSHTSPWLGLLPQNVVVPLAALVARKHHGRIFYPKTNNHNFFVCKKIFFTIQNVKQGHPLVEKTTKTQV